MGPNIPKNVKRGLKKAATYKTPKNALSITLIEILLDNIPYIIIELIIGGVREVESVSVSHYTAVLPTKYVKMGSKQQKLSQNYGIVLI